MRRSSIPPRSSSILSSVCLASSSRRIGSRKRLEDWMSPSLETYLSRSATASRAILPTSERQRSSSSAPSAASSSAAALGVGARRSATKSAIEKSISCPTALTTGTAEAAIARATLSSLNSQRSSRLPPPRVTTITSTAPTPSPLAESSAIAVAISAAAPFPWTRTGSMTTRSPG